MHIRFQLLTDWLKCQLKNTDFTIAALPGDASVRAYFRINCGQNTFIAMDAPPSQINCQPFIAIAQTFAQYGINVPEVIAADVEQGFLLLTDFGDRLYLSELTAENVDKLYQTALATLLKIQSCIHIPGWSLPEFNQEFIIRELALFQTWFIEQYCGLELQSADNKLLEHVFEAISQSAWEQPQVCMHRDFHSRNLILLENQQVGVLDFQDAVRGPITYDIVSLLRDCYITWPVAQVEQWVINFYALVKNHSNLLHCSVEQFLRWFDFMGLQRHLKVVGLFARLHIRDGKSHYLSHYLCIFNYIYHVCDRYPELQDFKKFLLRLEQFAIDKVAA